MEMLKYTAETDKGKVREMNEDNFLATGKLFAVADGMGGHQGGEVASKIAIDVLRNTFEQCGNENIENCLRKSFKHANQVIFEQAQKNTDLSGMGTTLTAAVVVKDKIYLGHVGDSRAYLLASDTLNLLTQDHSLMAQMVSEGKISEKEAQDHPLKSMITRALGAASEIQVDISSKGVVKGDKLLLATDGLTSMLSDEEILSVLKPNSSPKKICQSLIKKTNARGGLDNVTVVLVEIA